MVHQTAAKTVRSKRGQSIIEYVTVVTIVAAAFAAMTTYVFRSFQATQQMILDESRIE